MLNKMLHIENFKASRIEWFKEDIASWFPYTYVLCTKFKPQVLDSIVISRSPLEEVLPAGRMTSRKRVDGLTMMGLPSAIFSPDGGLPTDRAMISTMALMANGLAPLDEVA